MNIKCLFSGHDKRLVADGGMDWLIHQKGDRDTIEFYDGKLFVCRRCRNEIYEGRRSPYFRTTLKRRGEFIVIEDMKFKPSASGGPERWECIRD